MASREASSFLFLSHFLVLEENRLRVKVTDNVILCLGNIYIERRGRIRHFYSRKESRKHISVALQLVKPRNVKRNVKFTVKERKHITVTSSSFLVSIPFQNDKMLFNF